jgi:HSP20 family protein
LGLKSGPGITNSPEKQFLQRSGIGTGLALPPSHAGKSGANIQKPGESKMTYTVAKSAHWLEQFFTDVDRNWRSPTPTFQPAVDIAEDKDAFVVRAELPGVAKEHITVEVKDNHLVLSGKKEAVEQGEEGRYRYVESRYGSFSRRFELPRNVKSDAIEAAFKDGALTLRIPKAEEAKPKAIEIR